MPQNQIHRYRSGFVSYRPFPWLNHLSPRVLLPLSLAGSSTPVRVRRRRRSPRVHPRVVHAPHETTTTKTTNPANHLVKTTTNFFSTLSPRLPRTPRSESHSSSTRAETTTTTTTSSIRGPDHHPPTVIHPPPPPPRHPFSRVLAPTPTTFRRFALFSQPPILHPQTTPERRPTLVADTKKKDDDTDEEDEDTDDDAHAVDAQPAVAVPPPPSRSPSTRASSLRSTLSIFNTLKVVSNTRGIYYTVCLPINLFIGERHTTRFGRNGARVRV